MSQDINEFIKYLFTKYNNLGDIIKTFESCSRYGNNFLVNNQVKTINFDKLTEWWNELPVPQSSDSLSFSLNCAYLIEFKSGDQIKYIKKQEDLIRNVSGKINDSDCTLTAMYKEAFGAGNKRLNQIFCLVVDSKKMGITPLVSTLSKLSINQNMNYKEKILFEKVRPDLKSAVKNPKNYLDIEIWYSELFDTYLKTKKIFDLYGHKY